MLNRINAETLRSLKNAQEDGPGAQAQGRKVSEVVSYKSMAEVPHVREMRLQVSFCREGLHQ